MENKRIQRRKTTITSLSIISQRSNSPRMTPADRSGVRLGLPRVPIMPPSPCHLASWVWSGLLLHKRPTHMPGCAIGSLILHLKPILNASSRAQITESRADSRSCTGAAVKGGCQPELLFHRLTVLLPEDLRRGRAFSRRDRGCLSPCQPRRPEMRSSLLMLARGCGRWAHLCNGRTRVFFVCLDFFFFK